MWLSLPPTRGCHSKCKANTTTTTMALAFWLLFMTTVFMQQAQAGVIKKRETTPFAEDTRPTLEMTTTTAATTTTTSTTTIRPNHNPNIEESQLSKTTPDPTLATTPAELPSNDSTTVTKLVLQPVGKLTPMTGMESSKEYMHNEIALNETKKLLKISNTGEDLHNNNKKETEVVVVKETEKLVETTTASILSLGQADKEFGNDIASNPIQPLKESMTTGDVITQVQMINTTENVQHEEKPKTSNENSIETTESKDTAALPTTLTIKDNSLETNHIGDDSKQQQQQQTNEVATEPTRNTDDSVFSISSNHNSSDLNSKEGNLNQNVQDSLVAKENTTLSSENVTNHSLSIQDGLDRESLKDISNDLPDKTTENILKVSPTLEPLEINKLDYGRSMFKPQVEEEESSTLTLPNNDNSTDNPAHIANNIDLPDNNGKKGKFINDNSTNAQQMNLPGNAEVWSLAGLKSLPSTFNVTMETAPKHKADDNEGVQQIQSPVNNTHINKGQSEKFLLDWSHIMMDKDLAAATTISSYQEMDNNEVIANNEKAEKEESMDQTTTPSVTEQEEGNTNMPMLVLTPGTSTLATPITANSTILSVTSSGDDNVVGGDKQETNTTAAGFVDALNSFGETTTLATEIKPTAVASTTPSSLTLTSSSPPTSETVASPTSHTDLNEINLTLNKTAEFTQQENDNEQNSGDDKVSVTERAPETAVATAVVSTTTPSAVEQISSEPTTAFSTLESSKVNVSAVNEIFEKSQKYTEISENNNNNSNNVDDNETTTRIKENKENIELFATATTTEPAITTYKPKFLDILSTDSTPTTTTTPSPPPTTSTTAVNKIPIAEVVDQNGNEIEQQKQSINVETTTTYESVAGSFNNISSTIKTHLNEQVLLETTTTPAATTTTSTNNILTTATTANETSSEKTTSSSTDDDDDEIINKGKEEEFQLETITTQTTPKDKDQQQSSTEGGEEEEQVRNTTVTAIVIGSSTTAPPPPLSETYEKEQQEIETTTTTTAAASTPNETPVVVNITQGGDTNNLSESFASTTPEPLTTTVVVSTTAVVEKEKDEGDEDVETTTTKVVDTYFKFPLKVNKKEQNEEIATTTPKEEDDKDLETSTMSKQSSTTTEAATTAKEETYISLLDDSTTTTTIITSTTTTTNAPTQPPPPTTTTAGIEITSKIEEIYKVIVSTTTETTPTTTTPRLTSEEVTEETNQILSTTSRTHLNSSETTMLPVTTPSTSPAPTIVATADISGKSLPPLNTIMAGGNSGNMYPKNSDASGETDVNVIIAITVSVIGVIALILLVAFLYLMRKRQKQTSYSQRCRPVSLDEYAIDNGSVGGSMRKGSALRSSKRTYGNFAFDDPSLRHNAMGVHELAKFAVEKLRIFEEFRDVPQITAREDEVPPGCEDKNRYANVLPLPETRVVLQCLNNDDKTEYINANYVTGPKDAPNYYIACQAPLDTTVEDFWRMIWEQQSRVIIQATDLIENGVEKCADYLPPSVTLDNHSTFGDFQVTLHNREVKDKYAISTVLLKHTGENNATRELTHYWYKWPETGVPVEEAPIIAMLLEARSSLISYAIEQANEDKENSSTATLKSAEEGTAGITTNGASSADKETNVSVNGGGGNGEINGNISMVPLKKTARNQGPLTIHCSPGTGRTGTIIACDIAIRSLETPKRTVDVPQIVYHVRRGRASAVVTKEQYEFIYKVANMYAAKITNPTNYN